MAAQAGLCLGWSETPEDTFSHGVAHLLLFFFRYSGERKTQSRSQIHAVKNFRYECFLIANQVPGISEIFQASPEKLRVAQKSAIFQSPEILKNKSNFLIFMDIFMNFDIYMHKKSAFLSESGFYDVKYKNLRPIFAAARKNIFGKVVTLINTSVKIFYL